MAKKHVIIKNQMLKLSSFNSHEYYPVRTVYRGNNFFSARGQIYRFCGTGADTEAAAQAGFLIETCASFFRIMGSICRDKG